MNATLDDFFSDLKKVIEAETYESSYHTFKYMNLKKNTELYTAIQNYDSLKPFYNKWNTHNTTGIITDIRDIYCSAEIESNKDGSRGCKETGLYRTIFTVLFKKK